MGIKYIVQKVTGKNNNISWGQIPDQGFMVNIHAIVWQSYVQKIFNDNHDFPGRISFYCL